MSEIELKALNFTEAEIIEAQKRIKAQRLDYFDREEVMWRPFTFLCEDWLTLNRRPPSSASPLEWREMESAPKDGTVILVWRPSLAIVKIQIACFVNDRWETYGSGPMWEGYLPTHWMPLPSPPKKEDKL